MTTAGWIVMTLSITIVVLLFGFCLTKVLTLPPVEMDDIKGPLEIDTKDTDDAD
jgi:hypothetical protein